MKKLKKKKSQLYKKTRARLKEPINLTAKRPTIWFQSLNSEPTKINKRKIAISIYLFFVFPIFMKSQRERTYWEVIVPAKWWLVWDLFHAMMVVWRESGSGSNNNGIFLKFWNIERSREQRSGLRGEELQREIWTKKKKNEEEWIFKICFLSHADWWRGVVLEPLDWMEG